MEPSWETATSFVPSADDATVVQSEKRCRGIHVKPESVDV